MSMESRVTANIASLQGSVFIQNLKRKRKMWPLSSVISLELSLFQVRYKHVENTICFTSTLHSSPTLPVTRDRMSDWKTKSHRKGCLGNIPGDWRAREAFKRKVCRWQNPSSGRRDKQQTEKRQNMYDMMEGSWHILLELICQWLGDISYHHRG